MRSIHRALSAFQSCVTCGELLGVNEGYFIGGDWFCDVCGSHVMKERRHEGDKGSDEADKTKQNS